MNRTSYKKNRPFDFKLISLVEPHPVLYHRHWGGLSTFECLKEKNRIWNQIATEMEASPNFCLSRWNNLRNHFQRELRHCHELCPKEGIIRGSTWPYLDRLRFLEGTIRFNKPDKPFRTNKREHKCVHLKHLDADEEIMCEGVTNDSLPHNEGFVEFEELANEIFENEESAALSGPDELVQERLTNFEQMAELLNNIRNESKIEIERRIMAYLCKCQLRALVGEGITDLTI
ncbi:uncharacterized protein LOC128861332 [Anastrepha ludens]|uniref:uncharacterized protein LOC128861332 n=1 Tax=Anastrepha ludens TaxID=28586 RepID=UPI0023B1AAE9|nr:uncharacterized protein LOC128861332 [Anastrepha ludens]